MSKIPYFTVHHVADVVDADVRIVGITEDPENPSAKSFLFQVSLTGFTEDDRASGMDTYCVCDELGRTAYGPLESYDLTRTTLRLNFTDKGAHLLGVSQQVELKLVLSNRDLEVLRPALGDVIGFDAINS